MRIYRRLWRRRLHPAETALHALMTFATYGLWYFLVWRWRRWSRRPPTVRGRRR